MRIWEVLPRGLCNFVVSKELCEQQCSIEEDVGVRPSTYRENLSM